MSDSDIEPKEFQIKLRYKVGSEIHYTTLEKFEFLKIRESNMFDQEKNIVKNKMGTKDVKWTNDKTDYEKLKQHLEEEDTNEYKFNIPLSTYYFTFNNLRGFLDQKVGNTSSSQSKFSISDIDDNINKIKEYKSNSELAKKINEHIKNRVTDNNYFFKLKNDKLGNLAKLFNTEILQKSGYLNKEKTIGQGKLLICRFLYFIFYVDLEDYFKSSTELDLVNDQKFVELKAEEFLEDCIADDDKEKIVVVKSLDNLEFILKNLKYLNARYKDYNKERLPKERIPKIKTIKKIGIGPLNKLLSYYKSNSDKFKDSNEEPYMIFDLFAGTGPDLKFKFIEEIIDRIINDIDTKHKDELQGKEKTYKEFEQNKSKLFIIPEKEYDKKKYIKEYFKFLEENFKENKKYEEMRSARIDRTVAKHNTEEGRKKIVKDYGKYILGDEYYEKSDINELYPIIIADQRKLSYIITYYNIFEILKTLFLVPNNCILHNKFFTEIFNQQDGQNEIKKKEIYVKIKSIKCIKYTEEKLRESFEQDAILKPYYEIEFDEIPIYSNVIFNYNLIDKLNPKRQLEDTLEYYSTEFPNDKKSISEINSETLIYKRHTNDMFSKNKNIHPTKIFVKKNLDIKKMVNRFNIIKSNNKIFKSLGVETKEDALMIINTFNAIINEKELINPNNSEEDVARYIFQYYLERFYFEIDKHLFVDGKYAQIKKIRLRVLNKMSYVELENNKLNSTSKGPERFLEVSPSKTTRLAIDGVDSSYYVYLDVYVVFKNSPTDRIPIKDQINYGNDCIGKATVLDKLLYGALGINYPRRYLENKMRKKNGLFDSTRKQSLVKSILSAPKTKKEPVSEKSQIGGANKNLTRKIISKQKNKTMKNLVHYYTI